MTSDTNSYCLNNNEKERAQAQARLGDYDGQRPCNVTNIQLREITSNPISNNPIESIHKDISVLSAKAELEQSEEEISSDWKKAGEVLDRLFFILFAVTFLLFSAILFSAIPAYKN